MALGNISPDDIVDAAARTAPIFIQGATHPRSAHERWDYTFYAYYAVRINGWLVTLAVHQHIDTSGAAPVAGPGNMYIPGYAGWHAPTDGRFMGDFPDYDPNVHADGWVSDNAYRAAYFQGYNRYPRYQAGMPDFPGDDDDDGADAGAAANG